MNWYFQILLDPVRALDLADPEGKPSHSKVVGLFAFLALYALAWYEVLHTPRGSLDWVKWSLLFAAPFGVIGLRTWFTVKVAQRRETFKKLPTEPDMYTDDERGETP